MDLGTLIEGMPTGSKCVSGWAELRFQNPTGEIAGAAELSFSSKNQAQLRVKVESFVAEAPYDQHVLGFVAGSAIEIDQKRVSFAIGGVERTFTSLLFRTEFGSFSASKGIVWPEKLDLMGPLGFVKASIMDLVFTPPDLRQPRYWLVALLGPFEDLTLERPSDHVLALPDRAVYLFKDGIRTCAVQPLRSKTSVGELPYDAIAFGDVSDGVDVSDPIQLLPRGFLSAMSFALGANIQMPYIETRDQAGSLAARRFVSVEATDYRANGQVFSSFHSGDPNSGLGVFLESFFSVSVNLRERLIVPMSLVQLGTPGHGRAIELSITDLVKTLDNLVQGNSLAQQDLARELEPYIQSGVKAVLRLAREQLLELRDSAISGGLSQATPLNRIIERVSSAATTDRNFGVAVRMLLEKFGLADAYVLDKYYRSTQITYEQLLSGVRGQVIHQGHLEISDSVSLRSWIEFALHLHDICKRLILKEVGYTGTYQPTNVRWQGPFSLDRITPEMNPVDLGFSCDPPMFLNS